MEWDKSFDDNSLWYVFCVPHDQKYLLWLVYNVYMYYITQY